MRWLVPRLAGDASRRASAFPVAVLGLLLATRVSSVVLDGHGDQVPFTVALFVLPLLYALPGTRPLLARFRWLVLAAQGVLTWIPFALFGAVNWIPRWFSPNGPATSQEIAERFAEYLISGLRGA